MSMIECTAFTSIFDNKVDKRYRFESWEHFRDSLYALSKKPGYKPKRGERKKKGASPLITPAVFEDGTRRANDHVTHWSKWAALDVDEYEGAFQDVLALFKDYKVIVYSSASSTKEHPKFRVVFSLTDDVPKEKIKHFWYALNKEFNALADPQTKDLSRMYYVPAQYPNAFNFFRVNTGKSLNPFALMERHQYIEEKKDLLSRLPIEMQRKILHHRAEALNNTNISWTSYKDCPFISEQILRNYTSIAHKDGTGRYAMFYKLMLNIAGNAVSRKYPITPHEIAELLRGVDNDHGRLYTKRPLETEAERAIQYILRNAQI